jgi:hypothetical protein
MKEVKRVCIYPKDIMRITGKSERYSRKLLEIIKKENNKSNHQFITINEFSIYSGIDLATIETYLIH